MAASIRETRTRAELAPSWGHLVPTSSGGVFVQEQGPANGIPVVLFHGTAAWSELWRHTTPRAGRGRLPRHRARPAAVRILRSPGQLHAAGPGRAHQRRADPSEGRARHHRRPFLWRRRRDRTRDAIPGPRTGPGAGGCGAGTDGSAVGRAMDHPAEMDSRNPGVADHHQSGGDEDAAGVPDREERARAARIRRDPATADDAARHDPRYRRLAVLLPRRRPERRERRPRRLCAHKTSRRDPVGRQGYDHPDRAGHRSADAVAAGRR